MLQTSAMGVWDESQQVVECDPLRIMQKSEIWPCYQMVHTQTRICLRELDT